MLEIQKLQFTGSYHRRCMIRFLKEAAPPPIHEAWATETSQRGLRGTALRGTTPPPSCHRLYSLKSRFFFFLLFLFFLAIYKHNSLILSLREKRYLMLGTARNGGVRHVGDDARWARGDPNKRLACSGGQWCCKLWDGSVSAEPAMTPRFCESESIYIYIYRGFNGSDDYQMMHIKRYIIVLMKVLYESSGEERRRRRRRFCMKIYQNFGCYVHNSRLIWSISPSK